MSKYLVLVLVFDSMIYPVGHSGIMKIQDTVS